MKNAIAKGLVCSICAVTKTRAGVCRKCFGTLFASDAVSFEALTLQALCHFFGQGLKFSKAYLGGTGCSRQVDGSQACAENTKGAYPDIPTLLNDRVINIEVDENRHQFYDVSCELARYDTLQFGSDKLRPTICIRFNPHVVATCQVLFEDRIKILIQIFRNALHAELDENEVPVMPVRYLFYGQVSLSLFLLFREALSRKQSL
jgi:hypothetical protein